MICVFKLTIPGILYLCKYMLILLVYTSVLLLFFIKHIYVISLFSFTNNHSVYTAVFTKDAYIWITSLLVYSNNHLLTYCYSTKSVVLLLDQWQIFQYLSPIHPIIIIVTIVLFAVKLYFKYNLTRYYVKSLLMFLVLGFFWSFFNDFNLIFWNWDYVEFMFLFFFFYFIHLKHSKHSYNMHFFIITILLLFRNMFYMSTHHISSNTIFFFFNYNFCIAHYTPSALLYLIIIIIAANRLYFVVFKTKIISKKNMYVFVFILSLHAQFVQYAYVLFLAFCLTFYVISQSNKHINLLVFLALNVYFNTINYTKQSYLEDYIYTLIVIICYYLF